MLAKELISLCRYRMEKARQCLVTAKSTMIDGDYATSSNRSYYAIFHAMRAVLALDSLDFKKQSAVIGKFRELYIKTGVFDTSYSRVIGEAFDLRGDCDYEDFCLVTRREVETQIENAAQFLEAVQNFLDRKISASS
ncbi:HEPN domain-containing protein [Anaerotruncus colihominis]|uniref:HEPN domain-containing protein n=1 Tax=Anaerotruncus colihominis TaxID=169435 RepID=UPI00242EADE1|nr:HEPN domain-containing protein [Anaerotruncus colihominis]